MAFTKADETSKNNIFSDNTTTKMSYFNTMGKVSSTITTSTSSSSSQIRTPKSIHSLASSTLYTRTNNSNKKSTYSTPVGNSNFNEGTTLLLPIQTSSSGWPLLKDVITQRNNNSRELYKPNSLIEESKKLNTKSRKRLKRRRRILERKGHNRTRKLIKQKLKIKSRIKNNPVAHQKAQKKKQNPPSDLYNSHGGSAMTKGKQTSALPSGSTLFRTNKSFMNLSSRNKKRSPFKKRQQRTLFKSQLTTSINPYQTTINNRSPSPQPNDSMLADEGDKILSGIEPEVSMMDYAWNEDKIEIDFKTGRHRKNISF